MIDREKLLKVLDEYEVGGKLPADHGYRETLADQIVKLADSSRRNIPQGLYRNKVGAELRVGDYVGRAGVAIGAIETLGGDIAYAESDRQWGPNSYLVTEDSLRNCGYELIEPETGALDSPPAPGVADSGTMFPELKPDEYAGGYHYPNGASPGHSLHECNRRLCGPRL